MALSEKTTSRDYIQLNENYLQQELYDLIKKDEKIFNFLQDSVLDGLWFWDLNNPENEWMNTKFWTTLGYDPNEMPHKASAWQDIINQEDLNNAIDNFTKHTQDPSYPYDQIVRYTHRLGHTVWIRCRGLAIRDDQGKPIRMIGAHTDVTKLKRAEENLQKQLDKYEDIMDSSNLGTWEWNLRTGDVVFDEKWANLMGYSLLELQPVSLSTWVNFMHPLDHTKSTKVLQEHYEGRTPNYECEIRMKHKNGEWIWVLIKGKITSWDDEGNPEWVVGSQVDITQNKKALEKNRLFVSQAPSAIAMFDTEMKYLAASTRWFTDYNIDGQNIIGKSHYEIFPEIDEKWKMDHQECLKGNVLRKDEDCFIRKDGSKQWISWEIRPWYNKEGKIGGILMHTADITKLKREEEVNQERKIFLEAILDSIDVGIVSCDQNGKLSLFNKATKEWHGLPPEPVPPSELSRYYGLYKPDGTTPLKEEDIPLLRALKGEYIQDEEIVIIPKSGTLRKVITNGSQIIGPNGEVKGAVVAMHDITRIKEVEALNQERQIFLEAILDNINVGVGSCDKEGNITLFNKTTKSWFGLPDQSVSTSEWSNYFGLFKDDAKTPLKQEEIPLLRGLKGEDVNDYEIVITTKDNQKRHVITNATQLIGPKGEVTGAVVAMHDITDRKQTQEQLQVSEEAFRGNFENAAIGMSITNLKGQWIRVNSSFCDILGYTKEELTIMNFQSITHPEDLEEDLKLHQELLEGKRPFYHLDKRYLSKTGDIVYVKLSVSMVKDEKNKPLYFINQVSDITQREVARKRMENALAKLEGVLHASNNVGIISTDAKGLITSFNTGSENLLGYSKDELVGKQSPAIIHLESEMIAVGAELSQSLGENIEGFNVFTAIADRESHFTREWTYVRKDGTQFPVQLTVTAIRERGTVIGYLGMATDISEMKKAEKELKSILRLTEDQNKRLRNFAHIVSHNLKSHSGNFEMLLDIYLQENPKANESEVIQLFKTASSNLSDTIKHLNEVVLINNSIGENLVAIKLKKAIDDVIKTVAGIAIDAEVKIQNNVSSGISVMAIPAYLDSIILNFITNGIKYRSLDRPSYISFDVITENGFSVISIADNGIGIDLKKHRNKLFGMYKTFHNNPDARGIGLFITKNQVEALGGKIEARSKVNEGTTFEIYLKNEKI
ncbi:PAS domain-containing protein [Aquimarina sp. M1]